MDDKDIRETVLDVLRTVAPEAELAGLDPAKSFRDQIDIDSMDFLNFVIALEQRLDLRIHETDYPKLSSLEGCVAYLREASRAEARA